MKTISYIYSYHYLPVWLFILNNTTGSRFNIFFSQIMLYYLIIINHITSAIFKLINEPNQNLITVERYRKIWRISLSAFINTSTCMRILAFYTCSKLLVQQTKWNMATSPKIPWLAFSMLMIRIQVTIVLNVIELREWHWRCSNFFRLPTVLGGEEAKRCATTVDIVLWRH